MSDYKLYIIVRTDQEFSRGKLMVHAAHIATDIMYYFHPYRIPFSQIKNKIDEWFHSDQTKIILKIKNLSLLEKLYDKAHTKTIIRARIEDVGLYEVNPETLIMIGIFCDEEAARELGLKKLSLFK